MLSDHVNAYFNQKAELLKQCIKISEEILSTLESEEDLQTILSRREAVILRLKMLEEACDQGIKDLCTQSQKKQMDQQVKLLLAMDREATESISARQGKLLEAMKANKRKQQIANYINP